MLSSVKNALVTSAAGLVTGSTLLGSLPRSYVSEGSAWSPELEAEPVIITDPEEIVDTALIDTLLAGTKDLATDVVEVERILAKAWDNALLKNVTACELKDEFVQGLTLE
ncbi:hypothetical protein KIPB_014035, partial [Kipferlia bialata]|eukprot:g14035.t1